jgi:hypothetical protein
LRRLAGGGRRMGWTESTAVGRRVVRRPRRSLVVVLVAFALLVLAATPSTAAAPSAPGQLYAFGFNAHRQLGNPTNNKTETAAATR